jgi:hypothetical protein
VVERPAPRPGATALQAVEEGEVVVERPALDPVPSPCRRSKKPRSRSSGRRLDPDASVT